MDWRRRHYAFAISDLKPSRKGLEDLSSDEIFYILAIMDDYDLNQVREAEEIHQHDRKYLFPYLCPIQRFAIQSRYKQRETSSGETIKTPEAAKI